MTYYYASGGAAEAGYPAPAYYAPCAQQLQQPVAYAWPGATEAALAAPAQYALQQPVAATWPAAAYAGAPQQHAFLPQTFQYGGSAPASYLPAAYAPPAHVQYAGQVAGQVQVVQAAGPADVQLAADGQQMFAAPPGVQVAQQYVVQQQLHPPLQQQVVMVDGPVGQQAAAVIPAGVASTAGVPVTSAPTAPAASMEAGQMQPIFAPGTVVSMQAGAVASMQGGAVGSMQVGALAGVQGGAVGSMQAGAPIASLAPDASFPQAQSMIAYPGMQHPQLQQYLQQPQLQGQPQPVPSQIMPLQPHQQSLQSAGHLEAQAHAQQVADQQSGMHQAESMVMYDRPKFLGEVDGRLAAKHGADDKAAASRKPPPRSSKKSKKRSAWYCCA